MERKNSKQACEKPQGNCNEGFHKIACKTSALIGSSWAFVLALLMIAVWLVSGPFFHYSDTWQLVINTSTTIITFLVVFLIQNTQNRDAKVIHLKLDELIRAVEGARNDLVSLESLSDTELDRLQLEFEKIRLKQAERNRQDVVGETSRAEGASQLSRT